MMDSSAMHQTVEESSAGKYIVHDNGSLEVHHRYISDNDHLMFMCLTENQDGSFEHVFHVWNHTAFYQGLFFMQKTCQVCCLYAYHVSEEHCDQRFFLFSLLSEISQDRCCGGGKNGNSHVFSCSSSSWCEIPLQAEQKELCFL